MSSSARLKYKIVSCSSEDPEFPVSELLAHSSQTKGWQSARFCDFPQEIILLFETPVHLRQVQFLSHQSKIATKIELFTALPPEGQHCKLETAQFKRLGYLSLDSNERSQFQARELKSVYVDVSAQFLKVVLHKCHVNRYNIVNQVGLIALHASGEVLGPDLGVGPPPPNPILARNPESTGAVGGYGQRGAAAAAGSAVSQRHAGAQSAAQQEAAKEAAQAASDEMRFDGRTLDRIRSLSNAKQRAVDAEDYEEAKRCKEMLGRLRQTGQLLRELEDRKVAAVQNEDYDTAKALKTEIERLRMSIEERPQASPVEHARVQQPLFDDVGKPPPFATPAEWAPPQQSSAHRGAPQPASSGFDSQSQRSPQGQLGAAGQMEAPLGGRGGLPGDRDAMFGADADGQAIGGREGGMVNSYYDEPPQSFGEEAGLPGGGASGSLHPLGRAQSPPLHGAGGGSPAGGFPGSGQEGSGGAPPPMGLEPESSGTSEAAHHLRGVPNVEDILTSPEALPVGQDKDAELLVQLFGDYITRCTFSKTWNLRDAALQKLALDLRDGARNEDDPSQLLQAYSTILRRTIPDKNVQVNLSSGALLQVVARELLQNGSIARNLVHAALDPLMPLLVDRLGEPNLRVDKTARDALLALGRCRSVAAVFAAPFLVKPPKKKTVHARVYSSRLQVLTALANEFGVQPESPDGIPLQSTVQLAMEAFSNKDGEVRENSVKLVGACFMHVGLPRIEGFLVNLRPAQREVFDVEFDRLSGGPGSSRHVDGGDEEMGEQEGEAPEFTCQFCGRRDPAFTPEALDVHYWRDCPMLTQCSFCQQVIEISTLRSHLIEECESGQAARDAGNAMSPHQCPLCSADVGNAEDQDWMDHLLTAGCPRNPRTPQT